MEPESLKTGLSLWQMFMHSDTFMKVLMVGLLMASVWSWTIIFSKIRTFKKIREKIDSFEKKFWSGESLEGLFEKLQGKTSDPLSAIFVAAMKELKRSVRGQKENSLQGVNIQERIEKVMQITIDREIEKLNTQMIFLASTGSVSPLLGLFGTVWGIMDSCNAIGATQSTNIAAVAPGVAEALFTTAVGLIAAIPALIGYNKITHDIDRVTGRMETFSDELTTILETQRGAK